MDDEPMQLVTSYFPADLVSNTDIARKTDISPGQIDAIFIRELGRTPTQMVDELTARMPTPNEAEIASAPSGHTGDRPAPNLLRPGWRTN